jgi:CheY-like chemotaxis protein
VDSVLVVEADSDLRNVIVETMRDHGFEVLTACDGAAALELLRAGPRPTLVLLNTYLPLIDGLPLVDAIRRDKEFATLPIVSMSTDPRGHPGGVTAHVDLPAGAATIADTLLNLCKPK